MDCVVKTRGLTRKFGSFTAVDRIDLDIAPGEVCGFLGPNGAGKSTAIRMLCGILEPTSGEGTVLGYNLRRDSEKIKQRIGYMSQKFSLYEELSVRENLDFYAGVYGLRGKEKRLSLQQMLNRVDLEEWSHHLVQTLSPGFRQRLALACAIISRPRLLFLDEPTSGVSPISRREFFNLIQGLAQEGTTVIVSTHFMDEAERCNRIAFFSAGRLLALASPDHLKDDWNRGILVELQLNGAVAMAAQLKDLPFVIDANLYGDRLHLLLEDEPSLAELARFTGEKPVPIRPTLGDVFVALTRQKEREALP